MKRILLIAFAALLFALAGYQPVQMTSNGVSIDLGFTAQTVDAKAKCKATSATFKPEQGNWTVGGNTRHNVSVWSTEGKFKGELMLHLDRGQVVTLRNAGGKDFFRETPRCNDATKTEYGKILRKEKARKTKLTITVDELKALGMVADGSAPTPPPAPPVDCSAQESQLAPQTGGTVRYYPKECEAQALAKFNQLDEFRKDSASMR